MKTRNRKAWALLAVLCAWPTLSMAQSGEDGDTETGDSDVFTIDTVDITADRRVETPVNNIPGAVTVLQGEELREQLDVAGDVESVLSDLVPGYNTNTFPSIRGRRALVLINGAPQNETLRESSGYDIENIDPDAIQRIEVSRGATALFGYGAPGGVINIVTKRATSEELVLRSKIGTRLNPEAVSDSIETNVYQSVEQKIGRFDYYLGLGYERDKLGFDADGKRIPDFTGDTHDYNVDATLGYTLTSDSELVFRANYQHRELVKSWSLVGADYPDRAGRAQHDEFADDGYLRDQNYQLVFNDADLFAGTAFKAEAFLQRHYDSENQDFGGGVIVDDRMTNDSHGLRTTFNTPMDGPLTAGSRLVYGVDYIHDYFDRPAVNIETGEIETYFAPEVWLDTYAAYAQLDVPVGDWILSGGVRREEYRGETADTSAYPGGVTGGEVDPEGLTLFNVGAVYFLNDNLDVYGSISQGTNITQLGRAARSASRVEQISLQADPSTQYELGFRGGFERWRFTTATFYTESDKGVTLVPDPVDPANNPLVVRREPRRTWGFEATADYEITAALGVGGNFTWQEGQVDTDNDNTWQWMDAREISPPRLVLYVDYAPRPWWENRLQLNYRHDRDRFDEASTVFGEGNIDSLLLIDYFASFETDIGLFRFGIENLLNNDYFTQQAQSDQSDFTYVKGEGRTVSLSYSLTW
jgi:iron complex outermembrane receptor protein